MSDDDKFSTLIHERLLRSELNEYFFVSVLLANGSLYNCPDSNIQRLFSASRSKVVGLELMSPLVLAAV